VTSKTGARRSALIACALVAAAGLALASGVAPARAATPRPDILSALPSDAAALGGYDVLIADRGNDRVLLVSPGKKILWEYDFTGIRRGMGADDAFFADGGKRIIVNLEHEQLIEVIDIKTKKVVWSYGHLGQRGAGAGYLDFPDDAYKLPNGDVMAADIRNCRIMEIAPDKRIVRQAGMTRQCGSRPPRLAAPNGDTPLPNGHVLVSTIDDHTLIELDENWKRVFRLELPVRYPSDPQMTKAGNFLVCDYSRPGRIIEIDRRGRVVWSYTAEGEGGLNRPSLAIELPNGNILANDDLNHRVIVIGKASRKILWQYGVTGRRGTRPGYLHIPDGLDIIKAD
jgi:outer membrane protein assembly factor BamB